MSVYNIRSKVWLYPGGQGAWHFTSLSQKESEVIKKKYGSKARGWGSLPVLVTLGKTSWKTSIFPDKRSGTYLLPLKSDVRKKEGVEDGETIKFVIEIRL